MSLLARNALVLGSEQSDGLIKDSSGGLVLPRAMSQKRECNSKKKTATSSVTKASTKRIAH